MKTLVLFHYTLMVTVAANVAHSYESHDRPEDRLASEVVERCESAKEFITAYEYLRSHKELGLDEKRSREAATEIAKGCTGSASRFVKSFELLLKADAGPRSSLLVAIRLANKPTKYAETFTTIFTRSYLAEHLDLDYKTSFSLAESLSVNYAGDPAIAAEDFTRLVKFCTEDNHIGLSKPRCGVIAGRIIKRAENFQVRIAEEFMKVYEFLSSEKGPAAPVLDAIKIAEQVIAQGPEASDNFIAAYKYSIDKSGLDLTAKESVQFAKQISGQTWYNSKNPFIESKMSSEERLPAQDDSHLPE